MRPAQADVALERGDDVDVAFVLSTISGSASVPYVLPPGGVFALVVKWAGGAIACSSAAGGGLTWDPASGRLLWAVAAADTARLPLGALAGYRLALTDPLDGHRTLLVGQVVGLQGPAPGDVALDLVVELGGVTVAVTVDDAASGTTLAAAQVLIEAALAPLRLQVDTLLPPSLDFSRPAMSGGLPYPYRS